MREEGVRAVVLDWAGTVVDCGSRAPLGVFLEIFRRRGVEVTEAEGREPMGTHKREHIRQMCAMPRIKAAWTAAHGRPPTSADVDALYAAATPIQIEILPDFADPIPGALRAIAELRSRGIKITSTTGYNREMLDVLEVAAARKGYRPDAAVAASEVRVGRPSPMMCREALFRVDAWPNWRCVKFGDTVVDVQAGRNARMWSVGIALTGNLVGLDARGLAALSREERWRYRVAAREKMEAAGAHMVIDSAAELVQAVEAIEARLKRGERP